MLPNDGRVVSNFIVQALHNRDLAVHGDGSQTRSFMYADDPKQRCPDITLARATLGWAPEVAVDTGLAKTIDYFRGRVAPDIGDRRIR